MWVMTSSPGSSWGISNQPSKPSVYFCGPPWLRNLLNHRAPQSRTEIELKPNPQTRIKFRDTGFAHATEADLAEVATLKPRQADHDV